MTETRYHKVTKLCWLLHTSQYLGVLAEPPGGRSPYRCAPYYESQFEEDRVKDWIGDANVTLGRVTGTKYGHDIVLTVPEGTGTFELYLATHRLAKRIPGLQMVEEFDGYELK